MNGWAKQNTTWTAGQYVLVLLAFLVVALMGAHTIAHSAFWSHLVTGRWIAENGIPRVDTLSFSREGQSWVAPSWLYDWLLYGLWNAVGAKGIILLHILVMIGVFGALLPVMRKWAGALSIALVVLLGIWLIAPRYQVGPHLFALLYAAIFLNLLTQRYGRWKVGALLVLQVLWANTDSSFLLGPFLCAIFAVEALACREEVSFEKNWPFRTLAVLTVASLVATLLNPYHVRLWRTISIPIIMQTPAAREWISPFAGLFPGSLFSKTLITLALIIGAGGLLSERHRLPVAITTLAVVSAFTVVIAAYHVAVFAVLALPFIALSLNAIGAAVVAMFERVAPGLREMAGRLMGVICVAVVLISCALLFTNTYFVITGSASSFGFGVVHDMFPAGALELLSKPLFPAYAFNLPADGGYLLWRRPGRAAFVDARLGVYDAALFELGTQCLGGEDAAWNTLEEKWGVTAAILNCSVPTAAQTARALLLSQKWALAFFDGTTAVLLREQESVADILADSAVQEAGLQKLERTRQAYARALGGYRRPANSAPLIGAGNFYMALGRYVEAAAVYDLLTRGAPEMAAAWIHLGIARLNLGRIKEAEAALTQATRLAPKNITAWLQLSEVYARQNDREGERAALRRAQKLNAAVTKAFVESRGRNLNQ